MDFGGSRLLGVFHQLGEDFLLYSFAKNAAAEEKGINVESFLFGLEDNQTYKSVVTKAVAHFNSEDFFSLLGEGRDVVFLATKGGGVELVGALGELGEARFVIGSEPFELDLELEFLEKSLVAAGLLKDLLASEHGLIHRGALTVLCGGRVRKVQAPVMFEKGGDFLGILGKPNGGDSREARRKPRRFPWGCRR